MLKAVAIFLIVHYYNILLHKKEKIDILRNMDIQMLCLKSPSKQNKAKKKKNYKQTDDICAGMAVW